MKRRFQGGTQPYSKRLEDLLKNKPMIKRADDDGKIWFTGEEMYLVAKATGLKSKKKRHIIKRFRLVMYEAIDALIKEHSVDNTP